MNTYNRVLRMSLLTLGMLAVLSGSINATAQTVTREETVRSVRKMLERLPYYGVFDFIVFRIDRRSGRPNWRRTTSTSGTSALRWSRASESIESTRAEGRMSSDSVQ
jgi:cobalamin biosynthesis protein CbiD